LTFNGVIGGAGGLVKNGASSLTLNGANTFGGGWRSMPAAWCWATAVHWEPAR
jgi:hypothetical protein